MPADAVADILRVLDRDRYNASLILPTEKRGAIQALWTFSAEVAAIRERVSEPGPGEIRLQWWVDALEGRGHGDVRRNPVAAGLLDAIAAYRLQTGPLLRLLAARRFDLYQDPMPDMETFEGYAGEVASVLYQYAALILNDGEPVEPGDAAGHLGVADALIGHLRAFGYNASRAQLFLPLSVFTAHGVSEQQIFSGQASSGIGAALAQLADQANEHREKAGKAVAALPKPLRRAFASIAPLKLQLWELGRLSGTPFAGPPPLAEWRKIGSIMLWSLSNG